jgi:hypothetical protein
MPITSTERSNRHTERNVKDPHDKSLALLDQVPWPDFVTSN